ncbi:uncharacterized protein isoform X21 [Danio rerio]|uniref:Uncharacterized protein isoform X21 n=1 Tax=Danio rerio TaxID=7955 RepID=A0AC58ISU2_DANRE
MSSLSNQQPASPFPDYSELCKVPSMPTSAPPPAWDWQHGDLSAKPNFSVRAPGMTDEDKLCFYETPSDLGQRNIPPSVSFGSTGDSPESLSSSSAASPGKFTPLKCMEDNAGMMLLDGVQTPVAPLEPPNYCVIGVINDSYLESRDEEEKCDESDEEVDLQPCFMGRAEQQRKAMRRAMSECSHLSVPASLELPDKYPGVLDEFASPVIGASRRQHGAAMKRSLTVADDQPPTPPPVLSAGAARGDLRNDLDLSCFSMSKKQSSFPLSPVEDLLEAPFIEKDQGVVLAVPVNACGVNGTCRSADSTGGMIEENSEKNKPEVNKMDPVQKFDEFDIFSKTEKDQKMETITEKDKSEPKQTTKAENTEPLDKNKEVEKKTDETVHHVETPVKVEKIEKVERSTKDETEKAAMVEKSTDLIEKTEKTAEFSSKKEEPVEKQELKKEEVKVENKSEQKDDVKEKAEQKTQQDKTEEEKVEEKAEKSEPADKKPAKAETKDDKAKKAAAKPSAAKPALTNGAPGKDLSSPEKKTKPVAGLSKPSSAKPRPSSASTATAAPKRPTATSASSGPAPISKKAPAPKTSAAPAGTKRPATATARPPTATTAARDVKPKTLTEKRPLVPKPSTAPSRPAADKPASTTRPTASAPAARRPLAAKAESKPADDKKASTLKTTVTDGARSKPATARPSTSGTISSSASTRPRPTKTPLAGGTGTTPEVPRIQTMPRPPRQSIFSTSTTNTTRSTARTTTTTSTTRITSSSTASTARPSSTAAPDVKNIRSKIGSTDNIKHQPGGGKVSGSQSRTDSQISASKESSQGKVQILSKKIDLSKVTSKCGSKSNIKHKPGGGEVKIESHKVNYKDKAQSKVGSMDNVNHEPGGGKIKAEGVQETPCSGVSAAADAQENGLKDGGPCKSDPIRDSQGLDLLIPETN